MKRLLFSVVFVFVLSLAGAAEAYYPPYHYRGHTYSAPAVNGYYPPPLLGGYNVYTPSYGYPAYGFGAGFYCHDNTARRTRINDDENQPAIP